MKYISKDAARAAGLAKYFTGEPCANGHIDQRVTLTGQCMACNRYRGAPTQPIGAMTTLRLPEAGIEYVRQVVAAMWGVDRRRLERCQSDAQHNLWIDGEWIGRWEARAELERVMWDWLLSAAP